MKHEICPGFGPTTTPGSSRHGSGRSEAAFCSWLQRSTPLLRTVLTEMATSHSPTTVSELMSLPGIDECDHSSAYRLLKRLESEGIVTCLGVAHKAPH
jgi:hypothetical protein